MTFGFYHWQTKKTPHEDLIAALEKGTNSLLHRLRQSPNLTCRPFHRKLGFVFSSSISGSTALTVLACLSKVVPEMPKLLMLINAINLFVILRLNLVTTPDTVTSSAHMLPELFGKSLTIVLEQLQNIDIMDTMKQNRTWKSFDPTVQFYDATQQLLYKSIFTTKVIAPMVEHVEKVITTAINKPSQLYRCKLELNPDIFVDAVNSTRHCYTLPEVLRHPDFDPSLNYSESPKLPELNLESMSPPAPSLKPRVPIPKKPAPNAPDIPVREGGPAPATEGPSDTETQHAAAAADTSSAAAPSPSPSAPAGIPPIVVPADTPFSDAAHIALQQTQIASLTVLLKDFFQRFNTQLNKNSEFQVNLSSIFDEQGRQLKALTPEVQTLITQILTVKNHIPESKQLELMSKICEKKTEQVHQLSAQVHQLSADCGQLKDDYAELRKISNLESARNTHQFNQLLKVAQAQQQQIADLLDRRYNPLPSPMEHVSLGESLPEVGAPLPDIAEERGSATETSDPASANGTSESKPIADETEQTSMKDRIDGLDFQVSPPSGDARFVENIFSQKPL